MPHLLIPEEPNPEETFQKEVDVAVPSLTSANIIRKAHRESRDAITGALLNATEKLDAIRALHPPFMHEGLDWLVCNKCIVRWPCPEIEILERP